MILRTWGSKIWIPQRDAWVPWPWAWEAFEWARTQSLSRCPWKDHSLSRQNLSDRCHLHQSKLWSIRHQAWSADPRASPWDHVVSIWWFFACCPWKYTSKKGFYSVLQDLEDESLTIFAQNSQTVPVNRDQRTLQSKRFCVIARTSLLYQSFLRRKTGVCYFKRLWKCPQST